MTKLGAPMALVALLIATPVVAQYRPASSIGVHVSTGRSHAEEAGAASGGPRRTPLAIATARQTVAGAAALLPTDSTSPSKWKYLLGGAAIAASVAAIAVELSDDPMKSVVMLVVVPPSALLGAALGWVAYEMRH